MQIFGILGSDDLDRTKTTIGSKVLGHVSQQILAAELVLDFRKCVGNVVELERKKRPSTGGIRYALENLIVLRLYAADIRTDCINHNFRPLRHFDGFLTRHPTLVVVAVT